MDCGFKSLKELMDINIKSKTFWTPNKSFYLISKLLKTMIKMHELNIYHIDIKPANLIYNDKKEEF